MHWQLRKRKGSFEPTFSEACAKARLRSTYMIATFKLTAASQSVGYTLLKEEFTDISHTLDEESKFRHSWLVTVVERESSSCASACIVTVDPEDQFVVVRCSHAVWSCHIRLSQATMMQVLLPMHPTAGRVSDHAHKAPQAGPGP